MQATKNTEVFEMFAAPFEDHEIEWRVGSTNKDKSKGMMLPYVTNRAIMKRLDEVVGGENWYPEYRDLHKGIICRLWIRMPNGEWIAKEDGADLTNIEPTKGGISDAMKRAAVQWGIGRYLYDAVAEWVELKDGKYPVTKPTTVKFKPKPQKPMSVEQACATLAKATTLNELKTAFESLPANVKGDNEVIAKKDELKVTLG